MIGVNYFGMDPDYINNFVLLQWQAIHRDRACAADRNHPDL